MKRVLFLCLIGLILLVVTGCNSSSATHSSETKQELVIFAATQLHDAFLELNEVFEQRNEVKVSINFAGSQVVRTQIEQGAPADIFASADISHMKALQKKGLVKEDRIFSYNTLTILIPKKNSAQLESIEDLGKKKYNLVIGVEAVPIGMYARQFLDKANTVFGEGYKEKVLSNVASLEANTRAVAGKVIMGEADAGIVYVTDVIPSTINKVQTIDIPYDLNVFTTNTIAITSNTTQPELAELWVDFLLSDEGQTILTTHKFLKLKDVVKEIK
jgi:molybdate transport system substrate-binding protein